MKVGLLLLLALICFSTGRALAQDDTFSLGDGRFEINGKKPAGFTEFRYLYVEGPVLKVAPGQRLLPQSSKAVTGELYGRQKFKIRTASLIDDNFEFETVAVKGISFKFSGKVRNYYKDADQMASPQFKGTLTKFVKGRKAAEASVTFGHLEPEF